jgi:protein-L-isoaspartate(D-aspartate) O-methyltransferase
MVRRATDALSDAGIDTVAVLEGPFAEGYPSEGPFDAILLGGAVEEVPHPFVSQLREDGAIIGPLGSGGAGRAVSITRDGDGHTVLPLFNCCRAAAARFRARRGLHLLELATV